MAYSSPNPHLPARTDTFPPADFLQVLMRFKLWRADHPVDHLSSCSQHPVLVHYDFCCLPVLSSALDDILIRLIGINSRLWQRPPGFFNWFTIASIRSEELNSGLDKSLAWVDVLNTAGMEQNLYGWKKDESLPWMQRPIISIGWFRNMCHATEVAFNRADIAKAFGLEPDYILAVFPEDKYA